MIRASGWARTSVTRRPSQPSKPACGASSSAVGPAACRVRSASFSSPARAAVAVAVAVATSVQAVPRLMAQPNASVDAESKLQSAKVQPSLLEGPVPVLVSPSAHVHIHSLSNRAKSELSHVFGDMPANEPVYALAVSLRTECDNTALNSRMLDEREAKSQLFIQFGNAVCQGLKLEDPSAWMDFADPLSGVATLGSRGAGALFEVNPMFSEFGLRIQSVGCCVAAQHSAFGHKVMSAVVFTTAEPVRLLSAAVNATKAVQLE